MTLESKPLKMIGEEGLQELIDNEVREGKMIDYKRDWGELAKTMMLQMVMVKTSLKAKTRMLLDEFLPTLHGPYLGRTSL